MIDMGLGCIDWWESSHSEEIKHEPNEQIEDATISTSI
jgi:hypothetical protein